MLSELEHVADPRAALMWALGSSWVLVRMSLKEVVMQRIALVPSVVSVLVLLSLLLTSGFRQAMNSSITSWKMTLLDSPAARNFFWERRMRNLALEAEQRMDAKALAFAATRLTESTASADAAHRAVELDPSLTWVYYVVAVRNPTLAYLQELPVWSAKLKESDPQNGAPLLLEAESIAFNPAVPGFLRGASAEWHDAIKAAAQAPRFNDYLREQIDSDRDVVQRYGIWDPLLFIKGFPDRRIFHNVEAEFAGPSRASQYSDGALSRYLLQQPLKGWKPPLAARVVQIAALLIPGSIGLLLVGTLWRRRLLGVRITGAVVLVIASAISYFAYLPHSQNFNRLIVDGDLSLVESVKAFHVYGFPIVAAGKGFLLRSVRIAAIALVGMSLMVHTSLLLLSRRYRRTDS
jgi:hypothetical protein